MNFENILISSQHLTMYDVIIRVCLAFILGITTAVVYRRTDNSQNCSRGFLNTLAMLSMVTCMVMIVIGNNVARAFSLVGALSIIRFRTAVKDTRDTAFVFLALAGGMAAGTTRPALVVTIFTGIVILVCVLHKMRLSGSDKPAIELRFSAQPEEIPENLYMDVIRRFTRSLSLLGLQSQKLGQLMEFTYRLELKRGVSPQELATELSVLPGIMKVGILSLDQEDLP